MDPNVVDTAVYYGQRGNIVTRFKQMVDLSRDQLYFNIEFLLDEETARAVLEEQCVPFDEIKVEPSSGRTTRLPLQTER